MCDGVLPQASFERSRQNLQQLHSGDELKLPHESRVIWAQLRSENCSRLKFYLFKLDSNRTDANYDYPLRPRHSVVPTPKQGYLSRCNRSNNIET